MELFASVGEFAVGPEQTCRLPAVSTAINNHLLDSAITCTGLVHFDDFSPCGRTVRITDPKSKQSVNATVVDECVLCLGDGDIALSRAALAAFDVEQSLLPIFGASVRLYC